MSEYVALLRGPRLGAGLIDGAGLRAILSYIGFRHIRVAEDGAEAAFESKDDNCRKIEAELGYELRHATGSAQGAIVLPMAEMRFIAAAHPLADRGDESRLYVTVLSREPSREDAEMITQEMGGSDEHVVVSRAVYSYYGMGYEASRRSNAFFEKVTRLPATTRTWARTRSVPGLSPDEPARRFFPGPGTDGA